MSTCRCNVFLPGYPLVADRFSALRRAVNAAEFWFEVVPREAPLCTLRSPATIVLRCVDLLLSRSARPGEPSVVGLLAENPFRDDRNLAAFAADWADPATRDARESLQSLSHLVCSLASWHCPEDPIGVYYLRSLTIETTGGIGAAAVRIFAQADWEPPSRTHPRPRLVLTDG